MITIPSEFDLEGIFFGLKAVLLKEYVKMWKLALNFKKLSGLMQ